MIDTAGFEKDSFYFYTSQWREDKKTLHVVPQSWNAEDLSISGGKVPVYVYSNAAKVELYLNDKLIGTSTEPRSQQQPVMNGLLTAMYQTMQISVQQSTNHISGKLRLSSST